MSKKFSGCLEIIKNASGEGAARITNLHLKDAFGCLPHNLIYFTLDQYRFPDMIKNDIKNLHSKLNGKVSCNGWYTSSFKLNTGTFQGTKHILNSCKISLNKGRYTWRHN